MPLIYNGIDLTDRFLISNIGNIYSIRSRKLLKQTLNISTGYYGVCVSFGSRQKKKLIKTHIAVASMFVPGQKDGLIVNHKDGNKTNNNYQNLEWVTVKENVNHAVTNGLVHRCKKVKCLNNGLVFPSINEAANWCGLSQDGHSLREYFSKPSRKTAGKDPVTGERLTWELVS